jgi:flagellar hook protein FlgE
MSFTFQQALTGLDASAQQLDVLGNNIANSSTTGFKRSRISFGDVYANSVSATNNNPIGLGVGVQAINRIFTQGGLTTTNNPLDVGISGDGFFVVQDVSTKTSLYTRAGQFNVDAEGYLVTAGGQRVQGYSPGAGVPRNGPPDVVLQVPTGSKDATVTTNINASFNFNAVDTIKTDALNGPFDPTKPDSYNNSSSVTVFDQIGQAHTLSVYFRHVDSQKWQVYSVLSDGAATLAPTVTPAAPSTNTSSQADTIKPVLDSAYVVPPGVVRRDTAGNFNSVGTDVVLQYRENKNLFDTTAPDALAFTITDSIGNVYDVAAGGVSIDSVNNRVVLNTTTAIPPGSTIRITYTAPTSNPIADKAGNIATGFTAQAVTNRVPDSGTDSTPPVLSSASVTGDKLVLKYADNNILDRTSVPTNGDFTLTVDGATISPATPGNAFTGTPVVDPLNKTVTLTLANPIKPGQSIKLDYDPTISGINIRDLANTTNVAANFLNQTVFNFTPTSPVLMSLDFSGSGVLQNQDTAYADLSFDLTNPPNGTSPTATTPFAFRLNLASVDPANAFATTAYADKFAPNKLDQDGRESGSLAGFSIDNEGNLIARYSNGLTDVKGQIALANFKNPEKLRSVTGSLYASTLDSGSAQAAGPNSNTSNGRLGVMKPGTLELSNVDLTVELVGLITAQRNYQANAKTIQVQSEAGRAILQAI